MLICLVPGLVSAQIKPTPEYVYSLPADIDKIKKRGKLIVAMTQQDNPPFFYGEGKNVSGIDVDIARRVAALLEVEVEFNRDAQSFTEVVFVFSSW